MLVAPRVANFAVAIRSIKHETLEHWLWDLILCRRRRARGSYHYSRRSTTAWDQVGAHAMHGDMAAILR